MRIKIHGFDGGDRTSLDLPAPQQKLLEALAATGKPLIVVLQSGSAVALNWANEHANAILEAWYPGVEGGTAIARTLAGLNNPAGRLPVTFYAGLDGCPPSPITHMKDRTYRYFHGKPLWGFGYGLSYSTFKYGPVKLSADHPQGRRPAHRDRHRDQHRHSRRRRSRRSLSQDPAGRTAPSTRSLASSVSQLRPEPARKSPSRLIRAHSPASTTRATAPSSRGNTPLTLAGAQPQETKTKSEANFTITGSQPLPK